MNVMEDYTELYKSNEIELKAYSFIEVLKEIVFKVSVGDYSGKGKFVFSKEQVKEYIIALQLMYNTLDGECFMEDCEFGNTLKLCFEKRTLLIEGYLYNGVHTLTFSATVDQTIIPPLISLLKN